MPREAMRESGRVGTSDLGLRLGLVEVRRGLDAVSGVDLTVRTEAAWAQLRTAAGDETVGRRTVGGGQPGAGGRRGISPRALGRRIAFAEHGELHVRRDGGAGQTGTGLEVVAGNQLTAGRVRVDAQGRMLVLHSALGYRERGVGVTVGVGSRDREGLSLSVSPRWGDAATGGGRCGRSRSTGATTCRRRWATSGRWTRGASTACGSRAAGC